MLTSFRAEQSRAEQSRDYGLDVLRVLAMYSIFIGHYLQHGGVMNESVIPYGSFNYYVTWIIWSFWRFAVNVFPIISGYFLIYKIEFKWHKVLAIVGPVIFYSYLYVFISIFIFDIELSTKEIIKFLLPVKSNVYWFISAYIGMYIFHPYLNRLAKNLSKNEYRNFLLLSGLLLSVYSFTGFGIESPFGTTGDNMLWLIQMYFVGGYIRVYNITFNKPFVKYVASSLFLFVLYILLRSSGSEIITKVANDLFRNNSPILVFSSICMFVGFKKLKIKNTIFLNFIKMISPLMFGVYLIHEHPVLFMHLNIWQDLVKVNKFCEEPYWCLYTLYNSMLFFLVAIIMELIRTHVFKTLKFMWSGKNQ